VVGLGASRANANSLRGRNSTRFPKICATVRRDNLRSASQSGLWELSWSRRADGSMTLAELGAKRLRQCERLRALSGGWNAYPRANTLLTEFAYDWPPRVVPMPRALRASAIW
jgi:hypothetical protein